MSGRSAHGGGHALWGALVLVLVLLGVWELYVDLGGADPLILPAPHAIAQSLYRRPGTAVVQLPGHGRGGGAGDPRRRGRGAGAGQRHALLRHAATVVLPGVDRIADDPHPHLAPVLVLWLGFGILPKLVVIALVSFFSIVVTTLAGFAAVDPDLIKLMRTFDMPRRRVVPERRAALGAAGGVHRDQDRRHRGGDRGGVRRAGGRQFGTGLPVRTVDPAAADGARVRRGRRAVAVRDRAVRAADRWPSA